MSNILKTIAIALLITTVLAMPTSADYSSIHSGEETYVYYKLEKGCVISFTWYSDDTLDFYIEDSKGNRLMAFNDIQQLNNKFTVPYDSTWYIVWYNDHLINKVNLTFDVSVLCSPYVPLLIYGIVSVVITFIMLFIIIKDGSII